MVEVTGSSPVRITKKRRHSSGVECVLGKDEAMGSIPIDGSKKKVLKSLVERKETLTL